MYNFADRHIGINNLDKTNMLDYVGSKSIEELISETIPENIRLKKEKLVHNNLNLSEV